jgi:NitT/TauT family transport system ATP-binding protein
VTRDEAKARSAQYLSLVGLTGFETHYPHELSGGMQQRANLARALTVDPRLLLMDEPFSSLDAQTRELMQQELLRIWEEAKRTVLFVTHQIGEAIYLSDRVIVMSGRPGRIVKDIHIDFPRPRPLDLKRTPEFQAYEDEVWHLIEAQVRSNFLQTTAEDASA